MAFELISSEINGLVKRKLLHDIKIDRYLYQHSTARIVIDWDEGTLEGKRSGQPTAALGAAMLNAAVKLVWRGIDLTQNVSVLAAMLPA